MFERASSSFESKKDQKVQQAEDISAHGVQPRFFSDVAFSSTGPRQSRSQQESSPPCRLNSCCRFRSAIPIAYVCLARGGPTSCVAFSVISN